jgi:hypothetical protein
MRPIAFFNWQLVPHHSKLAGYERVLIGLVQAVHHWLPYLWGRLFMIKTDHFSLKYLLNQCLVTIPQHLWVSKLIDFDFRVEFCSGVPNVVVDALSRRETEDGAVALALSARSFQLFDDLWAEFMAPTELSVVILMVINCFSKYYHFLPLGYLYTTKSVAHFFFNNIVKLHGIRSSIVSDRDPIFTDNFWGELFSHYRKSTVFQRF